MLKEKVLDCLKEKGIVLLLGTGVNEVASDLLKSMPKPDESEFVQVSDDIRIHPKGVKSFPLSYVGESYDRIALGSSPCIIYNDTNSVNMRLCKTKYSEWLTSIIKKLQDDYSVLIVHCKDDKILGLSKRLDSDEVYNG